MTLSPAERFAASKKRAKQAQSAFADFERQLEFPLDDFQIEACQALESGRTVLVAAPTGAGKTIVGEFACHLAIQGGTKCFYTTPIKALSNQKFADLSARYGAENVGLLTGDNSVNGEAPIVVMTTEVLRNMLYADSHTLNGLTHVVMDEVHYLADRFRGGVWEEVIIHLDETVTVVALSATVSNAEEFGEWLGTVRGNVDVVVSERRPVPLWQHVLTNDRMYDLFIDDDQEVVNPELIALSRQDAEDQRFQDRNRKFSGQGSRNSRRGRSASQREPDRVEEVIRLERADLLPAIIFVFSRNGCNSAVSLLLRSGVRLTSEAERTEIEAFAAQRCASIPPEDLSILEYADFEHALGRGIAAHHAGMLPIFKEVVEELFTRGLVKVVFATETLALGINMPARSVLLERLVKWNGESHVEVTPGEYTQLTGRAGRRGIDIEGHAVVAWHRGLDPNALAGLASTRTYPLNSSFKPSYNMAVNLVGQFGRQQARTLLETSFAQFQADRGVIGLVRHQRRNEEHLSEYLGQMTCHLGDFTEYAGLRRALSDRETDLSKLGSAQRKAESAAALEQLEVGDVIVLGQGKRSLTAVVIDNPTAERLDGPRPQVLTAEKQLRRLSAVEVAIPVKPIARLAIPRNFSPRNAASRKELTTLLRALTPEVNTPERKRKGTGSNDDEQILDLRAQLRRHPCHGCNDREDHARWAERYWRLLRENESVVKRIEGRTNSISRTFDRVCAVLTEGGYLRGDEVTSSGVMLGRIYNESDLLIAEALREGLWDSLSAAELCATVSILVYESRRPEDAGAPAIPPGTNEALSETVRLWARLERTEREHGLSFLREPDLGLAWAAHQWASGRRLDVVLKESELTAGDFVRVMRQLIDLLGQIAKAGSPAIQGTADAAIDQCRRGIIALTGL